MPKDTTDWFSTTVRLITLVETIGAVSYMDCVYVFRVLDWDEAFQRALALGRTQEADYINLNGDRVRRRLKEVLTLDIIPVDNLDGVEVRSAMMDTPPEEQASFDTIFNPEISQPIQTL